MNLARQGKRLDGRGADQYREITLQKNAIPNAEGSALCQLGKTQVLAGIKFDIAKPYPDREDEGIFSTGAELVPLASPMFESGPPGEDAIELARVVDRGIRSSETLDLKSFFIQDEKVLALYLDLWVLDYGGNLIDCASLAAMEALLNTRMPKVEDCKIIRGESTGPLKLSSKVTTCTFVKIGSDYLLDPVLDEELAMDGRISFATTKSHVCAVQKSGWSATSAAEVSGLIDKSFAHGEALKSLLTQ
ncbi:exosome complex protein Rrp42 [Candidatus Parvarchaeota archaeon]|nr:exosome complex protein Rrp42 [Candidatus Parvarchaeota archaeon]